MLKGPINVTTTGDPGEATGSTSLGHDLGRLFLVGVHLDFHASVPATTDVTISESGGFGQTLLTLTNVNAGGWYYPRVEIHGPDGAALGLYDLVMVEGDILVEVAGCNALADAVAVTLQFIDNREIT
jgi:hypothetical protein